MSPSSTFAAVPRRGSLTIARIGILTLAILGPTIATGGLSPTWARAATGRRSAVVAPRPGQRIKASSVHIVVRAGTEPEDVRAQLNGAHIGREFAVRAHGRRVLVASDSDGLRRGPNTLKVVAVQGLRRRRETVHFTVTGHEPLSGAGRNEEVEVGGEITLDGKVALAAGDSGLHSVEWHVVSGPPGARLQGADSLTPTFDPTRLGNYTLAMTATSGDGSTTATTDVEAEPTNRLVPFRTQVAPTPGDARPGIEVGPTVYRAPWLAGSSYAGTAGNTRYNAIWQVLVLERDTLREVWNRTYGICHGPPGDYPCYDAEGAPARADLPGEFAGLGPKDLVVVSSHKSADGAWVGPDQEEFAFRFLPSIGFPESSENTIVGELADAYPGDLAVVGIPGIKAGDATLSTAPQAAGLTGYLTPDPDGHWGYVSSSRPSFDLRLPTPACTAEGTECEIAQEIDGQVERAKIPIFRAGYLVTAVNPYNAEPEADGWFPTASNGYRPGNSAKAVVAMTKFIEEWAAKGSLIAITSGHGRDQGDSVLFERSITNAEWAGLEHAIASLGGTLNGFNTAAAATGGTYALIGHKGLLEGEAPESVGEVWEGGELRGLLAADGRSHLQPSGTTTSGPIQDALTRLELQKPATVWPLAGDPAEMKAFSYIGEHVDGLGPDPRNSYVTQDIDGEYLPEIAKVTYPTGDTEFTQAQFDTAKAELEREVAAVAKVRKYLGRLARPTEESGPGAFKEAISLQTELEQSLTKLKAEAKVTLNFFSFIQALGQAVAIPDWGDAYKRIKQLAQSIAAAAALSGSLYTRDWQGSPNEENKVKADKLVTKLEEQSEALANSFKQLGNIIVSDPNKLFELGEHAECAPDQCGKQYEQFAFTEEMKTLARASTLRARDRTIYQTLVAASYPIWDTGLVTNPNKEWFGCFFRYSPFNGAPALSHVNALDSLDPSGEGTKYRTYISVHSTELTYGWAPKTVLERMFNPVPENSDPASGGLGMNPLEFMLSGHRTNPYESHSSCEWESSEPSNLG